MLTIDIVVKCECGEVLSQIESSDGVVTVEPCQYCMEEAFEDGIDGAYELDDED